MPGTFLLGGAQPIRKKLPAPEFETELGERVAVERARLVPAAPPPPENRIRDDAAHRRPEERARHAIARQHLARNRHHECNDVAVEERRRVLEPVPGRDLLVGFDLEPKGSCAHDVVDAARVRGGAARRIAVRPPATEARRRQSGHEASRK
jgi:hypothetical protein